MKNTILEMRGITKYLFDAYGKTLRNTSVTLVKDVNFDLRKGEVHILVGENGAGKSTLMNILGGILQPDEGQILLDGQPYVASNPKEAQKKGIAFIHQELNLCMNLDIAHNIFLGREPKKNGFVDTKLMYSKSRELLDYLGYGNLDPYTQVSDLSAAYQQVIEIVKCLSYKSKILIMDEPTTSLTKKEVTHLFDLIRKLKADGISIIYISHHFDELLEIGDRITVLRDGHSIQTMDMVNFDYDTIVKLMVGRTLGEVFDCKHVCSDEVILSVNNLKISERTEPINLVVHKGEVVGLGGLVGSGRSELVRCIFGARRIYGGSVTYKGITYTSTTPVKSIKNGIAYLSEDRKFDGIITATSIRENITLASLRKLFKNHIISKSVEKAVATDGVKSMKVACRGIEQLVGTLSGGNQQKVLFSKWESINPDLFIMDEPTRGIDVNTKAEIYRIIDEIAQQGVAVIMISSELPELIGMSDRICVMRNGTITKELVTKGEMTQENIMQYTLG